MTTDHSVPESFDLTDPRADHIGRRGQVDRRNFLRMGLIGTAIASAGVMAHSPAAGAAMLRDSLRTDEPAKRIA